MEEDFETRTAIGIGSGGRYSDPEHPVCAGCERDIRPDMAVWEAGALWHPECLPPLIFEPEMEDHGPTD